MPVFGASLVVLLRLEHCRGGDAATARVRQSVPAPASSYFFAAMSEPPILPQVPLATYFQSPGSLSWAAWPAHE